MLARIRKAQEEGEGGFTLIELLVVMIIIGILAAIAIPVFLSQRAKAQDTAAKADVSTLGKELASYFVDNTGQVNVVISGGRSQVNGQDAGKVSNGVQLMDTSGAAVANGTAVTVGAATAGSTAFCIGVINPNGSQQKYKYSSNSGLSTGNCVSGVS